MANIKNFGLVGVGSQVQFGKAGPQLVNNSGVFAFKNAAATADADITAGNLVLSGNLTVNGTQTVVNTTSITTADQTIILSNGSTTDAMASGAGVVVQGLTAHSILFDNTNAAFTTTDNFNLVTGKQYEINGVPVLTATALGSAVTGSSLTSVGTLTNLTVAGTSALQGAVTAGSTLTVTGASTLGATTVSGGLNTDTMTATGAVSTGALTAASALITNLAGTGTRSVSVDANGNLVAGGSSANITATTATLGDISIAGDTISTVTTDADLVLAPNGAGTVTAPSLTLASLTAGQVVFAGTGGAVTSDSGMTYAAGVLTVATVTGLATPVNASDAVNKSYVDAKVAAVVGGATANSASAAVKAFAFDAAGGAVQIAAAVTGFVHRVKVYVNTAFTDAAATLQVGLGDAVDGSLAATTDLDPSTAACYVVEVGAMATAQDLTLFIAPGTSTAGAGYVVIEWI